MTTSRLVNKYSDVAVFYSEDEFDQVKMDAGSGMFFLPEVQDLKFGFDSNTKKDQSIGSSKINFTRPNRAPDVSLDISILENFETIFEDVFTGGNLADDLDNGRNFYFLISDDDERVALSSYKSSISIGNCFLDSLNISQSLNGVITSDYSYVGSNIISQEFSGSTDNKYLSSSGLAPSVNLSGDQDETRFFLFSGIDDEILSSNYYGEFVPGCKTFVKVSGIGTDTCFLIKPNNMQSFSLDLKLNRKRIDSVSKYFPLARKVTPPLLGNISFENKFSDIETGDSLINFLKNPEEYHISISGEKTNGKSFLIDISKAFLQSKNINGSISSNLSESANFAFDLKDMGILTTLTSINLWNQNNGTIWDINDFIWDTIND